MNQQLGLILGIAALVLLGLSNSITKIPAKTLGPNKLMFWRGILMTLILGSVVLITGEFVNFSFKYFLITIAISIIGYIPLYFFLKGMGVGKVGIISPVSSIYTIFTTFLAVTVYKEKLPPLEIGAIAVIIMGTILISVSFRDFKNSHLFQKSSGIYYAIIAALGWGLYFFLIRIPVMQMGAVLTSYLEETMMLIIVSLILIFKKEKFILPKWQPLKPVIIIGFLSAAGVLAYYQGIKIYSLSIMTAFSAAGPLIVCLYGGLVYKERLQLKQYISIVMIVSGIIVLALQA